MGIIVLIHRAAVVYSLGCLSTALLNPLSFAALVKREPLDVVGDWSGLQDHIHFHYSSTQHMSQISY